MGRCLESPGHLPLPFGAKLHKNVEGAERHVLSMKVRVGDVEACSPIIWLQQRWCLLVSLSKRFERACLTVLIKCTRFLLSVRSMTTAFLYGSCDYLSTHEHSHSCQNQECHFLRHTVKRPSSNQCTVQHKVRI